MRSICVCGGDIVQHETLVDALALVPVPAQPEPLVKITRWQCMRDRDHNGERREPSDG